MVLIHIDTVSDIYDVEYDMRLIETRLFGVTPNQYQSYEARLVH